MLTAIIVSLIIICILFAPLSAEISFTGKESAVRARLLGITIFKADLKKKKKAANKETKKESPEQEALRFEEKIKRAVEKIHRFADLCKAAVRLLKRLVKLKYFGLCIHIGTADAAVTAVSTGALWASAYTLLGVVGVVFPVEKHNVEVVPEYNKSVFRAEAKCIFKSTIAYIIVIALTILIKTKQGGAKK